MKKTLILGFSLVLSGISPAQGITEQFSGIEFERVLDDVPLTESCFGTRSPEEYAFLDKYEKDTCNLADSMANPTFIRKACDLAKETVATTAKAAFHTMWWGTDKAVRHSAAYLAAYYGEEVAMPAFSMAARCVATLATGSVSTGKDFGDTIDKAYGMLKRIPGIKGVAAWSLTPFVKLATDEVITHGPAVVGMAYQASKEAISRGINRIRGGQANLANTDSSDLTKEAMLAAAKAAFYTGLWTADKAVRHSAAYLAAYYGEEFAVRAFATTACVAVTLATGNPIAGQGVKNTIEGAYRIMQYIPGMDGVAAWNLAPFVKLATDEVITHGPSAVRASYQFSKATVSKVASWFYGTK